jgi:hypothetical protein
MSIESAVTDEATKEELRGLLDEEREVLGSMYRRDTTGSISPEDRKAYDALALELIYTDIAVRSIGSDELRNPSKIREAAKGKVDKADSIVLLG